MRSLALNLTVLLATCLIGLVLCELFLRFFYPKYEAVAEAEYELDEFRIWKRTPNGRGTFKHPDTGLPHPLNYNNLGLRQARDFSEQEIKSNISIGFFGDSWTENIRMAVQYSFTEPLDYLLNIGGEGVNVLNFGVEGYGTGQSFLHYRSFKHRKNLDYVVYVYFKNDLRNIYETNLFRLDDEGNLLQNVPPPRSPWVVFISKLHISYLFLDVAQRLNVVIPARFRSQGFEQVMTGSHKKKLRDMTAKAVERNLIDGNMEDRNLRNSVDIFKRIIFAWKKEVERNGGKFYIVVLPVHSQRKTSYVIENDFRIIDLHGCFSERDTKFPFTSWGSSRYPFKNNGHWSEAGNRLAAVCLYRFLEQEMDLPTVSEADLQDALGRYYSAFEEAEHTGDPEQEMIRARYSTLPPARQAE